MTSEVELTNRVAVVTGASRGLGWEIAGALAQRGAAVALVARDQEALDDGCAIDRRRDWLASDRCCRGRCR